MGHSKSSGRSRYINTTTDHDARVLLRQSPHSSRKFKGSSCNDVGVEGVEGGGVDESHQGNQTEQQNQFPFSICCLCLGQYVGCWLCIAFGLALYFGVVTQAVGVTITLWIILVPLLTLLTVFVLFTFVIPHYFPDSCLLSKLFCFDQDNSKALQTFHSKCPVQIVGWLCIPAFLVSLAITTTHTFTIKTHSLTYPTFTIALTTNSQFWMLLVVWLCVVVYLVRLLVQSLPSNVFGPSFVSFVMLWMSAYSLLCFLLKQSSANGYDYALVVVHNMCLVFGLLDTFWRVQTTPSAFWNLVSTFSLGIFFVFVLVTSLQELSSVVMSPESRSTLLVTGFLLSSIGSLCFALRNLMYYSHFCCPGAAVAERPACSTRNRRLSKSSGNTSCFRCVSMFLGYFLPFGIFAVIWFYFCFIILHPTHTPAKVYIIATCSTAEILVFLVMLEVDTGFDCSSGKCCLSYKFVKHATTTITDAPTNHIDTNHANYTPLHSKHNTLTDTTRRSPAKKIRKNCENIPLLSADFNGSNNKKHEFVYFY